MHRKELLEKLNDNQAKTRSLIEKYNAKPSDELGMQIRGMKDVLAEQMHELKEIDKDEKRSQIMEEGKDKMNKVTEVESRAMASLLRYDARSIQSDKSYREYRDNSLTAGNTDDSNGNGGLTIPTTISNQIIEKLTDISPVFAQAGKLSVGNGYAEILRETNVGQAGFVGELESLPKTANQFTKIYMKASRVGAYMQITNQLIQDSAFDITQYSVQFLTKAMAKAIERNILVGEKKAEGFESVESQADANHTIVLDPKKLTYGDLIDFYVKLHPSFLDGSMLIVSHEMFDAIAKLTDRKDGSGDYLLGKNMVSGTPDYKLFGIIPVVVSDSLDASNTDIIFGNFEQGYKVMVQKGMSITHVTGDSTQAIAGGHLIVMDAHMDGAVVNPEAFIISQRSKSAGVTPKAQIENANTNAKSGNQPSAQKPEPSAPQGNK